MTMNENDDNYVYHFKSLTSRTTTVHHRQHWTKVQSIYSTFTLRSIVKERELLYSIARNNHRTSTNRFSMEMCFPYINIVLIEVWENSPTKSTIHCEWHPVQCSPYSRTTMIIAGTCLLVNFRWCFMWLTDNRPSHTLLFVPCFVNKKRSTIWYTAMPGRHLSHIV